MGIPHRAADGERWKRKKKGKEVQGEEVKEELISMMTVRAEWLLGLFRCCCKPSDKDEQRERKRAVNTLEQSGNVSHSPTWGWGLRSRDFLD